MVKDRPARISREMCDLVSYIKAQYLIKGKTPPSTAEITRKIVNMIDREDLMYEKFIKFK